MELPAFVCGHSVHKRICDLLSICEFGDFALLHIARLLAGAWNDQNYFLVTFYSPIL
jgi:hypothetical protein